MKRINQTIEKRTNGQVVYWIQYNGITGGYIAAVNMYDAARQPLLPEDIIGAATARLAAEAAYYSQDKDLFEREKDLLKLEMLTYLDAVKDNTKITEVWTA